MSKPARYYGICVGGIADGHFIGRDDAEIKIDARRPVKDPETGAETGEETVASSHYKFLILLQNSEGEIGVWALQGLSVMQVLVRVLNHYNPRTGLIGTPKPNVLPLKN